MAVKRYCWHALSLGCFAVLGGCAALQSDKTAGALADREAQKHADEAKPSPSPKINSDTYWAAGRMLEGQGDLGGAIAQYEKAIAADPHRAGYYNQLGIVYQRLGRWADADQVLRRGLQADPQSALLWNNLGCSSLGQGRYADAEKDFRQAVTISPTFQRARMNRGIALAQMGQLKESIEEFSLVVSADAAHYNLALILAGRRDYAGAEKALTDALAINPECPGAKEQLAKVRQLVVGGQEPRTPATGRTGAQPLPSGPSPVAVSPDEDAKSPGQ